MISSFIRRQCSEARESKAGVLLEKIAVERISEADIKIMGCNV